MAIRFRKRPISLQKQLSNLNDYFPESSGFIKKSCLYWKGKLRPTDLSRNYKIEINYKIGKRPRVKVIFPTLTVPREYRMNIHMFRNGDLCLYYKKDWNESMLLVETIVPWTCEWLFFYELWKATGKWLGGGIHPH